MTGALEDYLHLLLYGLPALFLLLCLFSDYAFAVGSFKSLRWTSILYLVTMPLLLAVEVPLLIALLVLMRPVAALLTWSQIRDS